MSIQPDLEQLTEDKLFPSPIPTDEQYKIYLEQKERAMKAKVIALEDMGKHPLTNPSSFSRRDKDRLLKKMREWFEKTDDEITAEFNDIIIDKVLNETSDYEKYSVAGNAITFADPPPKNPEYDIAMNKMDVESMPFGIL